MLIHQSLPISIKIPWLAGLLLIASGLAHVGCFLLDDLPWEGPVSWRKPIFFGVSTGLTLCSIGWVLSKLPRRSDEQLLSWILSGALVLEVGLITVQQWRSVPSHFNQSTPLDRAIDFWMLALIVVACGLIVQVGYRSITQPLAAVPEMALAIRNGMALLIVSCAIGFVISWWGYRQLQLGLGPGLVGQNGVAKFPHGVAIHAIQFLPLIAWTLQKLQVPPRLRMQAIVAWSWSLVWLLVYAGFQTITGRSRWELSWTGGLLLCCLIASLAWSLFSGGSIRNRPTKRISRSPKHLA